jgi:hypothetical protein
MSPLQGPGLESPVLNMLSLFGERAGPRDMR